jgi:CPA2 family monovalent cation:H+ antiporter-2
MENPCSHLDWARVLEPAAEAACADCRNMGDTWVHLRMCLTCGYVGCCDNSANRHAYRHFLSSRHPLMRSLEPGERWVWCHLDRFAFLPDDLPR